jgi:hypothetical protein
MEKKSCSFDSCADEFFFRIVSIVRLSGGSRPSKCQERKRLCFDEQATAGSQGSKKHPPLESGGAGAQKR